MWSFVLYAYGYVFFCLTLGVLVSQEKLKNDFTRNLSVWLLGLTLGSALLLWPLTFLVFLIHRQVKNKKNGVITGADEDLFLHQEWQETSGVGRKPKEIVNDQRDKSI